MGVLMNEQELRAKSLEIAAVIGERFIEYDDVLSWQSETLKDYFQLAQSIENYIKEGNQGQSKF
jgi:hypothetical protein